MREQIPLLMWMLGACALRLVAASGASAQTVEEAEVLLASGDREQIEVGIQSLGLNGTPAAVPPLTKRIRQGLPPELLETAVITLMALGQEEAAPVLYNLMSHRRPVIRLRAVEAITALKPKGAESGLVAALSDADVQVRDAAAKGLGEIGTPGSLDVLFQALDKGNMEASAAIGRLTPPNQISRITGYLGRLPVRSLRMAFTEVLTRKDIPTRQKLRIIGRLQEVGTSEIRDFFNDLLATSSDKLSPKLSKALLTAIRGIAE